jgi:hypothetical protein
MTNCEKIRAEITDDEIAFTLANYASGFRGVDSPYVRINHIFDCKGCKHNKNRKKSFHPCGLFNPPCKEMILEWLKQEADHE